VQRVGIWAAPPVVIIHILLAWKSPARVIGGIAASTKAYDNLTP